MWFSAHMYKNDLICNISISILIYNLKVRSE
jgi:hypothetical protein